MDSLNREFREACKHGDLDTVRRLLAEPNQIDINSTLSGQLCYLSLAVVQEYVELVGILLTHPNIDVNKRTRYGFTPLSCATNYGNNIEILSLLLTHPNIDVNMEDRDGYTPLCNAISTKKYDMVRILLEHPNTLVNESHLDVARNTRAHHDIIYLLKTRMDIQNAGGAFPQIPSIFIPLNQEDTIYGEPILNGMLMADFHEERIFGRYYTKSSYEALHPKRNPITRRRISRSDVIFYIADVPCDASRHTLS